jgi:lipopolysaccharide export system permease protein
MNLDAFQHAAKKATVATTQDGKPLPKTAQTSRKADKSDDGGALGLLSRMGRYYLLQSTVLLDLLGPTACVLSVMATMALLVKHGELHPILAAGISTYRLATPFVIGVIAVNGLMAFNQEFIIPRIASELQGDHGDDSGDSQTVEAQFDPASGIYMSAEKLQLAEKTILKPEFLLFSPQMSEENQKVTADSARYYRARGAQPGGWLLKNPSLKYGALLLSEAGKKTIFRQSKTDDLFIASSVSADQLFNRGGSYRYLSTPELINRIQMPAGSLSSARAHIMHLHSRLTRPVITLIGVFLVLPLIARREKWSLVGNVAVCMAVLGFVYGLSLAGNIMGQSAIMKPEVAAWGPLVFGGGLCAWLTGSVRT